MTEHSQIDIAFNNLKFITLQDGFLSNKYSIKNKEFVQNEEDTFDTIYGSKELEYPIYFTFHQIMNHIHSSYSNTLFEYSRLDIIDMFEMALDTLYEYNKTIDDKVKGIGDGQKKV